MRRAYVSFSAQFVLTFQLLSSYIPASVSLHFSCCLLTFQLLSPYISAAVSLHFSSCLFTFQLLAPYISAAVSLHSSCCLLTFQQLSPYISAAVSLHSSCCLLTFQLLSPYISAAVSLNFNCCLLAFQLLSPYISAAVSLHFNCCLLTFQLLSPLSMTGAMAGVTLPSQSQVTEGGVTSTVIGWGYLFVSVQLFLVSLLVLPPGGTYTTSKLRAVHTYEDWMYSKHVTSDGLSPNQSAILLQFLQQCKAIQWPLVTHLNTCPSNLYTLVQPGRHRLNTFHYDVKTNSYTSESHLLFSSIKCSEFS
jgi:hypothetical protein